MAEDGFCRVLSERLLKRSFGSRAIHGRPHINQLRKYIVSDPKSTNTNNLNAKMGLPGLGLGGVEA